MSLWNTDIREVEGWKLGDLIRCTKCRSVVRYNGIGISSVEGEKSCPLDVSLNCPCDATAEELNAAEKAGRSEALARLYYSRFRKLKVMDGEVAVR